MEENYYYVPIEQIKENQNLREKETYIGKNIEDYNIANRIKKNDGGFLYLIVSYNEVDKFAYEILTGKPIPILSFIITENANTGVYKAYSRDFDKLIPNFNSAYLYILEKIVITRQQNAVNETFNDCSNIKKMKLEKAKVILEEYKNTYTKEKMQILLDQLEIEGKKIIEEFIKKEQQERKEKNLNRKYIYKLLNELKNQS